MTIIRLLSMIHFKTIRRRDCIRKCIRKVRCARSAKILFEQLADCSYWNNGTQFKFLQYVMPEKNCAGEGHQHVELSCYVGEAFALRRVLVLPDNYCLGKSHMNANPRGHDDDRSTTFNDYYDIADLHHRGVNLISESGLRFIFDSHCLERITPKKQKVVQPTRRDLAMDCSTQRGLGFPQRRYTM